MRQLARSFAIALAWLGAMPACLASAPQPPTLRWLVQDLPPHFNLPQGRPVSSARDLGDGEVDGMLKLLIARLPQYRHEFLDASLPRFETLVRQGVPLCSALHVRTPERLEWLYFTHTHPWLLSRQLHVIVHRDNLERFRSLPQPLRLADLLQRKEFVGLLSRDRSYGPRIDALLKARGSQGPQTLSLGRPMQLLGMLQAKRMDYTLEYPSAVQQYMRVHQAQGELVRIPLADTPITGVATVACSRTPEGRRYIEAIDAAVRGLAQEPNREAWMRTWRGELLDDQDRQRIQRYMDERAQGGPQIE